MTLANRWDAAAMETVAGGWVPLCLSGIKKWLQLPPPYPYLSNHLPHPDSGSSCFHFVLSFLSGEREHHLNFKLLWYRTLDSCISDTAQSLFFPASSAQTHKLHLISFQRNLIFFLPIMQFVSNEDIQWSPLLGACAILFLFWWNYSESYWRLCLFRSLRERLSDHSSLQQLQPC